MNESLTQAHDCAEFVRSDLCATLQTASRVEAIIILDLIERAADLRNRIANLQEAMK